MPFRILRTKQFKHPDGRTLKFKFLRRLKISEVWNRNNRRRVQKTVFGILGHGERCPGYQLSVMVFSKTNLGVATRVDVLGEKLPMERVKELQELLQEFVNSLA